MPHRGMNGRRPLLCRRKKALECSVGRLAVFRQRGFQHGGEYSKRKISRSSCMIPSSIHGNFMMKSLIFLTLFAFVISASSQSRDQTYDLLISNARIVDGTGVPWYVGDIGVRGDKIVAMGNLRSANAKQRIDAAGLVASPGFIDVQGQSEFNLLVDGRAASKITQGVTTEITGEGTSIAPLNDRLLEDLKDGAKKYGVELDWRTLDEYLQRYDRAKPAINLGTFVGAGGIRTYVIGKENRPATAAELQQMRQLVAQAMQQGAFGLSTAL